VKGNLYEILGLKNNASKDDIEVAYGALKAKGQALYDQGDQEASITLFSIKAAYEVLHDPVKRGKYDEKLVGVTFQPRLAPTANTDQSNASDTTQPAAKYSQNLVRCSACGQSISRTAKVCPHCGEENSHIDSIRPTQLAMVLGLVGCIVLFLGVFMPIIHIPMAGNINYFHNGKGDGIIILVLVAISLYLILKDKFHHLLLTGMGVLAVLGFTFIRFQMKMSDLKEHLDSELSGNPFRGLADATTEAIQLQWGWAVLIIGALLLMSAAIFRNDHFKFFVR
jgi:hypothetical protein